jgi:hypothetical protein
MQAEQKVELRDLDIEEINEIFSDEGVFSDNEGITALTYKHGGGKLDQEDGLTGEEARNRYERVANLLERDMNVAQIHSTSLKDRIDNETGETYSVFRMDYELFEQEFGGESSYTVSGIHREEFVPTEHVDDYLDGE